MHEQRKLSAYLRGIDALLIDNAGFAASRDRCSVDRVSPRQPVH